ncbi:MAG: hypothetical protein GF320_05615 [Armatimonadia bacterium]|nr:hypothetical protein [Armatimonadia bacterium]
MAALLLAIPLACAPVFADDEEELTRLAEGFTRAAADADAAALGELLHADMLLADPRQGLVEREQALASLSDSHMPADVNLGTVNMVVGDGWAFLRMPWEHPAIDAGNIDVSGACIAIDTPEGWKVVVQSTVVEPREDALVSPDLLEPYEEQAEQLDERLEEIDRALAAADHTLIKPLSHPESRWVATDPTLEDTVVASVEQVVAHAAQYRPANLSMTRVADASDALWVGLRCAAVVRTYEATSDRGPLVAKMALLLYWSPEDEEWLIVGAGVELSGESVA